jgi:hypothetical protein
MILYILCPNNETLQQTEQKYKDFKWARPLLLPPLNKDLPVFENSAYEIIDSLRSEWIDKDYVGTLSFRFQEKISLEHLLKKCSDQRYDYVHFFVNEDRSARNSGISNHGDNFGEAWDVLKANFFPSIRTYEVVECVSNYWMSRPRLMLEFIEWHRTVLAYAKSCSLFYSEAFYGSGKLSKDELLSIWNKPYYPLLPFVLERFSALFFANHSDCFLEQNIILRTLPKCILFCLGTENDFVDVKHNALPFLHNRSKIVYIESEPETELSNLRKSLFRHMNDEFDYTFVFSGQVRVFCAWKRIMSALLCPDTAHSNLYYLGFCPLNQDRSKWSYDNMHVYSSDSKNFWQTCKLTNVVYGGGIAFQHGNKFYEELVLSKSDGTLSDYLWQRNENSVGIFPQFVLPHKENDTEMLKFCNSRFTSLQWYARSLHWRGFT